MSTTLLLASGTINTPFDRQQEIDKIPLTEDPESNFDFSWFNFDWLFPEFEIPALNSVFGLTSSGLFIIVLLVLLMIVLFFASIFISRVLKRYQEEVQSGEEQPSSEMKELIKRRITLGRKIEDISAFLQISLKEGDYKKGITEGFEKLDTAMKEFSKISRPGWLTPREYANMRIPYFNQASLSSAVEIFYRSTYSKLNSTQQDMNAFIKHFKDMIIDFSILKWKADSIIKPVGEEHHE
ncbi:MAG: hypothetical protein ACW98F_19475 [Candidatus Hodarchaeales archaeon]